MRTDQWGDWGNLPADGDVKPFSMIAPDHSAAGTRKKRHHYLSVVYLEGFADASGRVWAYQADRPDDPHHAQPQSVGYRKHYYAQTHPEGVRDDHRWEDLWGCVEMVWPVTLAALRSRRLSPAISFNILGMVAILRARVPAARERNELLLAHKLRTEVQALETIGKLPDNLWVYAGRFDAVPVGINSEQSLPSMRNEILENGDLAFRLGFEVLHNRTGIPFLTTDNPICIYDPRQPVHKRVPYEECDEVELLFPIDAWTLLRGSTRLKPVNMLGRHRNLSDKTKVRKANRTIAQFGYRLYIGQDRSCDNLITSYAATVPTVGVDVRRNGKHYAIHWWHCFGPRPQLSQYIDTPEKAARLAEQMAREGWPMVDTSDFD